MSVVSKLVLRQIIIKIVENHVKTVQGRSKSIFSPINSGLSFITSQRVIVVTL